MKYCPYCGSGLEDDMVFCPKCGKKHTVSPIGDNTVEAEKKTNKDAKGNRQLLIVCSIIGAAGLVFIGIMLLIISIKSKSHDAKELSASVVPLKTPTVKATEEPMESTTMLPTSAPTEEPFTIVGNTEAIEKISKSVVKLTCYDEFGNEYASGSGFFAFEPNLIVTNYHVIEGNVYSIKASTDDLEFDVEYLVNYNERYDIALLKVTRTVMNRMGIDLEPLTIGDSSALKISEHVTAIGVPLGISKTVSDGMISGFYEDNGIKLIQFTAPISHGSSGGALLNDKGEVIGITSASFSEGQNFNLTVPSSYISILYNANAKGEYLTSFHDKHDHFYSVDYCLNHPRIFRGGYLLNTTITIYGYVSSTFISSSKGTSNGFCESFLASDQGSVIGFYADYDNDMANGKVNNSYYELWNSCLKKERFLTYNQQRIAIYAEDENHFLIKRLVPGTLVSITGKTTIFTNKDYPDSEGLTIIVSDIKVFH